MVESNKQAAQSLTTGEDTSKKRGLVARASQPNKKREGGHLWSNIFVIAFCAAGLALTMQSKVRGDWHVFRNAFAVAIGISGAEIVLNIVLMIISTKLSKNDNDEGCCKKCGPACLSGLISIIYLVGCCVCFGLLVYALTTSMGVEETEECGCANNFGCANIMAIIACIVYGLRVLSIAICLPCIICASCCACSACCIAASTERTLEAGAQSQQNTNL